MDTRISLEWKRGCGLYVCDDIGTTYEVNRVCFVGKAMDNISVSCSKFCVEGATFVAKDTDKLRKIRKEREDYPAACVLQAAGGQMLIINLDKTTVSISTTYEKRIEDPFGASIIAHHTVDFDGGRRIQFETCAKSMIQESMQIKTEYDKAISMLGDAWMPKSMQEFDDMVNDARKCVEEYIALMKKADAYTVEDFLREGK